MTSRSRRPFLSVVVITKDEEADLPGFLENFQWIADEIVIIDDGSADRTKEIADSFGRSVRFIPSPRTAGEGFCDQRRKGVEAATGDWLLQVDCDMRLTPELAIEIQKAISETPLNGFRFRLAQYFMNRRVRFGGFQYWNQPWLSRRSATSWTQKVHERIHIEGEPASIGQLSSRMVHLNDQDFGERLAKNRLYSRLDAERRIAGGESFSLWRLVFIPFYRFLRSYILMLGFLDGSVGFLWSFYQFTSNTSIFFYGWSMRHGGDRRRLEAALSERMQTLEGAARDPLRPADAAFS